MADYFESGFSVRQPAWHGHALVLDDYPGSWDEARQLAGLEWEPVMVPTFEYSGITADGTSVHAPGEGVTGEFVEDVRRRRVIRSDTGRTLAIANDSYQLITHEQMGQVVELILDQPGVRYETAGVLEEGRAVWALALLDEPVQLKGAAGTDESLTLPYLSVLNRHDGAAAFRVASTSVRIVCANTWRASEAEGNRTETMFAFRHTRNWTHRIDEAREVINGVRRDFRKYRATASELLGITVSEPQRELFVRRFVPMPPEHLISDRVVGNVEQARQAIRAILQSPTTAPVAHTAFGLMQAAGEYADHIRTARSWETRLGRTLLRPDAVKARAAGLVRAVATTEVSQRDLIGV